MICAVCSDDKDVKKHYGVNCCYGCKGFFRRSITEDKNYSCSNGGNCSVLKESRNRCRACRLQKCLAVGMDGNQLRDTKFQPKSSSIHTLPIPSTSTSAFLPKNIPDVDPSSLNLVNFLTSMTQTVIEVYDQEYEKIEPHEWTMIKQEKCNRNISLMEGIKNPEKVCPRTKWDFSCSRLADGGDLSYMWYRTFVSIADWANNIPEFRMLPEEDQAQLLRMNFTTLSFMIFTEYEVEIFSDVVPLGNGSFIRSEQIGMDNACVVIMNAYIEHVLNPLHEMNADSSERALLYAINLFQYLESLSSEGKKMTKTYVDKLYDAFFDYQIVRFPNTTAKERTRRQSQILMVMVKMTQIWTVESDIHLILSTFNNMNIDGIPKELLFHKFGTKV